MPFIIIIVEIIMMYVETKNISKNAAVVFLNFSRNIMTENEKKIEFLSFVDVSPNYLYGVFLC